MRPRSKRREGIYQYWLLATKEAGRAGYEAAGDALVKWLKIKNFVEENMDKITPCDTVTCLSIDSNKNLRETYDSFHSIRLFGVDSSITKPVRLGFKYVSFVSASAIWVKGNESGVSFLDVKVLRLPEEGTQEGANLERVLKMFSLESSALKTAVVEALKTNEPSAIFLDGPLVDPPGLGKGVKAYGLWDTYKRYLEARTSAIAEAAAAGVPVIGYVKRLRGRSVTEALLTGKSWASDINDAFLGASLASLIAKKAEIFNLCMGRGVIVATRPSEVLDSKAPDYAYYRELLSEALGKEAFIYTSVIVPRACRGNRRAARIEFIVKKGEDPVSTLMKVSTLVEASYLDGGGAPEPVILAHKSCTIKRKESLKLLRESATVYALETLTKEPEISKDLINIFHSG